MNAVAGATAEGGPPPERTPERSAPTDPAPHEPPTGPHGLDGLVTFVSVSDLAASHAFWCDIIGLTMVLDQGDCRIYRVCGGAYVGCCRAGATAVGRTDDEGSGLVLTLVTDDVDGRCAQIIERGGVILEGPKSNERFGIYHAFLRDPDGHTVEIQRFDAPDWNTP